jgi:hypothetical protein
MHETVIRSLFSINDKEIHEELDNKIKNGDPKKSSEKKDNNFDVDKSDQKLNENSKREIELSLKKGNSNNLSFTEISPKKKPNENDQSFQRNVVDDEIAVNNQNKVKEEKEKEQEVYFFSLWDNFILLFCKCFASRKLIELELYYNKLLEYSLHYTDVVYLSQNVSQIEKIKYVLFTKKQMALFHKKTLDNPLKQGTLADFYNYAQNREAQNREYNNFIKAYNNTSQKKSKTDRRLFEIIK